MKSVAKSPINNIPALVQIMAWRHPGDKPLSEPMMVGLLTHICVTRPQWVKQIVAQTLDWMVIQDTMMDIWCHGYDLTMQPAAPLLTEIECVWEKISNNLCDM